MEGIGAEAVDEHDRPLAPGEVGALRFRGPHFPKKCWSAEDTAQFIRDGWFYPMDLGYLDEDGYLFLAGRSDDVISCMEAKFYPVEIERVLVKKKREQS